VAASILICHGAADSFISAEQVATLQKNLADAGADWEFIAYANAKHGFTNPDADKRGLSGLAYNEKADRRSWQTLIDFLAEVCK
jgi:dienelactone hydrolase